MYFSRVLRSDIFMYISIIIFLQNMRGMRNNILLLLLSACVNIAVASDLKVESATLGNLCGVDHLGRVLPESKDVKSYDNNKKVALFYYLWHGQHGTHGPYDISKMLAKDPDVIKKPDSPLWPDPSHAPMLHWGEPLFGYYQSTDEWVLRRHVQMFIDAGIDVLFFDVTNGFSFRKVYNKLFKILAELKDKGFKVPQFAFYMAPGTRGSGTGNLNTIWEDLYEPMHFSDLYFKWNGKPIIVCHDNRPMPQQIRDFFTFRRPTWVTPDIPNTWYWEGNPKPRVARDENGKAEMVPVSVGCAGAPEGYKSKYTVGTSEAHFGVPVLSRSFTYAKGGLDKRPNASHYGFFFEEQIQYALNCDAPLAFVTQFNEWLVPFLTRATNQRYKMKNWILLQDECDIENSRDIEPMRGGYHDAYYFQLISFVRRFKGLPEPALARKFTSIDMEGDWSQWESVSPRYVEYTGDVAERFHKGYDACGVYENKTGRNEFVELRVAVDEKSVVFYAKTSENITAPAGENWMNIFVKVRPDKRKGWEGFQYLINRKAGANGKTSVEASNGGWNWSNIGDAEYKVEGNKIMIKVPRDMLGLNDDKSLDFEFKWSDNMQEHDIMDFYVNGDAAPRGRLNYLFQLKK